MSDAPLATLVVEARDLDADARSRETAAVSYPTNPADQRLQLAEAAAKLHPRAKMRSFANGAATFLDRQHLIVAFYADLPAEARAARRSRGSGQAALFA